AERAAQPAAGPVVGGHGVERRGELRAEETRAKVPHREAAVREAELDTPGESDPIDRGKLDPGGHVRRRERAQRVARRMLRNVETRAQPAVGPERGLAAQRGAEDVDGERGEPELRSEERRVR